MSTLYVNTICIYVINDRNLCFFYSEAVRIKETTFTTEYTLKFNNTIQWTALNYK